MKSLDAVYQVLSEERTPLHIREITTKILTQKLWETKGKTPAATLVRSNHFPHFSKQTKTKSFGGLS